MSDEIKFLKGSNEANLPSSLAIGSVYFCENTGNLYIGDSNKKAKRFASAVGKTVLNGSNVGEIFNDYTNNKAKGNYSHAEGIGTLATGNYQHVQGKYNLEDTANTFAHIVGNGNSSTRANIHTIDWNGNAWFLGDVFVGGTNKNDAIKLVKSNEVATSSTLGLVKSGTDITVDADGNVSVNDSSHNHAASNITSGTLAIARIPTITVAKGGTGATTAAGALVNLGLTATATELNYCDGVTSNIQTQLNNKQATINGAATTITSSNLTASRVLISNSSGKVAVSSITSTKLGYLTDVTSNIQAQLNKKATNTALTNHTGNTSNPHGVTKSQVGLGNVENKSSATIRGELTKSNVTTALGYTPVNKAGDSMSGPLQINTSLQDHSSPTAHCLVINSSTGTPTLKNSPGIGFHIANVSWGSLIFDNNGFKFINSSSDGYMPVYASTFYGNLSGNASTASVASEASVLRTDESMKLYAQYNNEINFGGNSTSSTIYFGYRAADSKPIPTNFVFGGNTGTATITAASFTGTASSAHYATRARYLECPDTRAAVINPSSLSATTGVQFDFKQASAISLTSDSYSGVMSYRPYSSSSDWSGGPAHQIAYNKAGLYWRQSSNDTAWGAWYRIMTSANFSLSGTTLTITI